MVGRDIAVVLAASFLPSQPYASTIPRLEPQHVQAFHEMWRNAPPLRHNAKGLPKSNMRGLHDVIAKRPYLATDRQREAGILAAFRNNGLYPSSNYALQVTCRGDICETLLVTLTKSHRPAPPKAHADPLSRIAAVNGRACGTNSYPASMRGRDKTGHAHEILSFFCILNSK